MPAAATAIAPSKSIKTLFIIICVTDAANMPTISDVPFIELLISTEILKLGNTKYRSAFFLNLLKIKYSVQKTAGIIQATPVAKAAPRMPMCIR